MRLKEPCGEGESKSALRQLDRTREREVKAPRRCHLAGAYTDCTEGDRSLSACADDMPICLELPPSARRAVHPSQPQPAQCTARAATLHLVVHGYGQAEVHVEGSHRYFDLQGHVPERRADVEGVVPAQLASARGEI